MIDPDNASKSQADERVAVKTSCSLKRKRQETYSYDEFVGGQSPKQDKSISMKPQNENFEGVWKVFEEVPIPSVSNSFKRSSSESQWPQGLKVPIEYSDSYKNKLARTVILAVEEGNADLVDAILLHPILKSFLSFCKQLPTNLSANICSTSTSYFRDWYALPSPASQPNFGLGNLFWHDDDGNYNNDNTDHIQETAKVQRNVNLLSLACERGHLEVVKKLLAAGLDINALENIPNSSRSLVQKATIKSSLFSSPNDFSPLMKAINKRHDNIVLYLLEQTIPPQSKSTISFSPHKSAVTGNQASSRSSSSTVERNDEALDIGRNFDLILTSAQTSILRPIAGRRPGGSARRRCTPTSLSLATEIGAIPVVEKLVQMGALDASSTSRANDPFSLVRTAKEKAELLVKLSFNEALWHAYEGSAAMRRGSTYISTKEEIYADLLEILLIHSGRLVGDEQHHENVISVYILNRIIGDDSSKEWENIQKGGYTYRVNTDCNFLTCDNRNPQVRYDPPKPSCRAIAIVRGLRHISRECLESSGVHFFSAESIERLEQKRRQWQEIVQRCQDRLEHEEDDYNAYFEQLQSLRQKTSDAENEDDEDIYFDYQEASRQLDLSRNRRIRLLWCKLFCAATAPWSKEIHHLFPKPVRRSVHEILNLASALSRQHGMPFLHAAFEQQILPFLIS